MPDWLDFRGLVFAWLIIAANGAVAAACILRFAGGSHALLPPQRRRAVMWTGPLVVVAFVVFYAFPGFISPYIDRGAIGRWFEIPETDTETPRVITRIIAAIVALPLQLATWRALALLVDGPRNVFGVVPKRLGVDFIAAFRTWLWLTPLVYLVNFFALLLYYMIVRRPPGDHPLMQILHTGPQTNSLVVVVFTQAVIVAPIVEEVFFRGILQPFWAERSWGGAVAFGLAMVIGVMMHTRRPVSFAEPMSVFSAAAPALFVLAMFPAMMRSDAVARLLHLQVRDTTSRRQLATAIVGNSLLFANLHSNVMPTPIPLFVLALGLGWLAARTQGVFAPIVLHVLFNSMVFLAHPLSHP